MFAILAAQQRCKRTDLLVRAPHDRKLGPKQDQKQGRLFATMREGPPAGEMALSGSQLSRRAKSGRITSQGRPGRPARLEGRYRTLTVPPTQNKNAAGGRVSAVHVRERAPPAGAQRLDWYRLTPAEVRSAQEAKEMVRYYQLRWRVEDLFRVLKTGGRGEKRRLQPADRLHCALTLHMVTA